MISFNKRMGVLFMLAIGLFILSSSLALAIPNQLTIQGRLLNASGSALEGPYNATFKIYAQHSGGSALYEYQTNITADSNGAYEKILPSINLNFSDQYFLGITIANDSEATPRINLTSSPYAMRSNITESINPQNSYSASSLSLQNNLSLGQKISFNLGQFIDAATSGIVQISSSLSVLGNLSIGSAFTIDATNGRIGIGNTIPNNTLDVSGNANISGTLSATTLNISGTVQAARFVGDGSGLSGVSTSTFNRENVSEYLGGVDQNASIIRAGNLTLYNRSISLDTYNRSVSLDSYNRSISLDNYNRSISLDNYNRSISLVSYITSINGSTIRLTALNVSSINGTDIAFFNKSISLDLYNKSVSLVGYNKSISLDGYNRSVSLDGYNQSISLIRYLTSLNGTDIRINLLNVTSINGTDIALFNKSISLDSYNRSISLDNYNRSISLDSYNKSIFLDSYNKSISLDSYNRSISLVAYLTSINDTNVRLNLLNVSSINGTDIAFFNKSISLDLYNQSISLVGYNKSISLDNYNQSISLDLYNKSISLDTYAKTSQVGSFLSNNTPINASSLNVNNTLYVNDSAIGIGTANPVNDLSIAKSGGNSLVSLGVELIGGKWLELIAGTSGTGITFDSSSFYGIFTTSTRDNGNPTELLRVTSSGNVGINTTSPAQTLTVQGTLNVTADGTAGPDIFVASSGNVGIGTATPSKNLVVNGTLDAITLDPSAQTPTINTTGNNLTLTSMTGSVIIKLG